MTVTTDSNGFPVFGSNLVGGQYLPPKGVKLDSCDAAICGGGTDVSTSGALRVARCHMPLLAGTSIAGMFYVAHNAAVTPSNLWLALIDLDTLKVLAVTPDNGAGAVPGNARKDFALASPYVAPKDIPNPGLGYMMAAATVGGFKGAPASVNFAGRLPSADALVFETPATYTTPPSPGDSITVNGASGGIPYIACV